VGEIGEAPHHAAVARLRESYAAIEPGQRVRLAKRTSNLFRPRASASGRGLDVSGLGGVIAVDPVARVADVQGMCTYEDLTAVTLQHGLIPYVVPQLRTITLGGAVAGLGIESTSFRNGLPHESVLELDVFTGAGDVVATTPDNEHADLFRAFPNSYGSVGYATRARIRLEPAESYVALRHVRFHDADKLAAVIAEITDTRQWSGERVDGLDGVAFGPGEYHLTLARWTDEPGPTSDYTGSQIYYRSLQQREIDRLTMADYLWRWDTDWFWCSGAFGVQKPAIRRMWPRRFKRSDVYHRLVGLDQRFGIMDRLDRRAGRPARERVVQDIEIPVDNLPQFLDWFDDAVGMRPVWLCPLVASEAWPSYPLQPGHTYVNVGFWGTVPAGPTASEAPHNRAIEAQVHQLGGHKSLYSDSFYDPETFNRLYGGDNLATVKRRYDPDDRLTSLYEKAVKRR
jgi:FAD/FMN-containing dehydrogenase